MTGLRSRIRDRTLPERADQSALTPLTPDELCGRVAEALTLPGGAQPVDAVWDYARWKPGVSMTCAYTVRSDDGSERTVVAKRYADGKEQNLARKWKIPAGVAAACAPLQPRAILADEGLVLWAYPADRMLRALATLPDPKRFAGTLVGGGVVQAGVVRRRKTVYRVLRYKPERRAVYRVDLRLRRSEGRRLTLAVRAHPAGDSGRIAERRRLFAAKAPASLAPRLLACHAKNDYLVEEWLDVEAFEPDSFDHAWHAGATLARLHRVADPPVEQEAGNAATPQEADTTALFAVDSRLTTRAIPDPPPRSGRVWSHRDFHPDQVGRRRDSDEWTLLDLDDLNAGDALEDLASWVADDLFERSDDVEQAAEPLLAGYESAGGSIVDRQALRAHVAAQLVARAAGSIRRLEEQAVDKSLRALELARSMDSDRRRGRSV